MIHKATLVPRGHALGMVRHLAKDDLMHTRQEMLAHMDVAMGGRAAGMLAKQELLSSSTALL